MRRTKEDAQKTREALLKQGYKAFTTTGYEGSSLSQIVSACGLTRGAAYWHFSNKDDLYMTVVRQTLSWIKGDKLAIIQNDALSTEEKITELLYLPIEHRVSYRLVNRTVELVRTYPQFQELLEELTQAKDELLQIFFDLLEGRYDTTERQAVTARILYFLFEGFYIDAQERQIDRATVQAMVAEVFS